MEIAIVLGLLALVLILFATEKLSVDVITGIMLVILILTNIITPEEAFAGFSSDFIFMLASIFVISGTLMDSGVLDAIGAKLVRLVRKRKKLLSFSTILVPGILSAFMNNTAITAIFIGPFMGIAKNLNISPSKILMPLAFTSIVGGTITLIGTSTNIAVSGALPNYGIEALSMFEFTQVGLILFAAYTVYMIIFGDRIMPGRQKSGAEEDADLREYLSEVLVSADSKLVGQPVLNSKLEKKNLNVLKVIRGNQTFAPGKDDKIQAEDLLLVQANSKDLIRLKESNSLDIKADAKAVRNGNGTNGLQIAEILITPGSVFTKKDITEPDMDSMFNIELLGLHRMNHKLDVRLEDVCLNTGDMLLVQGHRKSIKALNQSRDFLVVDEYKPNLFKERKGYITLAIFIAAILAGSLKLVALPVAYVIGVLLIILLRITTPERAYQLIDWRMLILIAGMTAFGKAMEKSGASEFLATQIVQIFKPVGVIPILAAFVVLVVILTQPMSNAAAALVVLPVAIATAQQLAVNPKTFAICIMLGASVSLVTPLEPSSVLVYGLGKYKFKDFVLIGGPITIILLALIVGLVPVFWPL